MRSPAFLSCLLVFAATLVLGAHQSHAAVHRCQAVAQAPTVTGPQFARFSPGVIRVANATAPKRRYQPPEITIRFLGHSTFLITSPKGVIIATDFSGLTGGTIPTVVTMNHAHESHWTAYPDPKIKHVLKGWGEKLGEPARHDLEVQDVHIKNVPTNIRSWSGDTELNGNSIFVFAVAGLCVGHVGHLHHPLTKAHIAQIGQLDIVMVPVDGGFTLDHPALFESLKELRTKVVMPMHWFSEFGLDEFLNKSSTTHVIQRAGSDTVKFSIATLPKKPTILVLSE